METDRNYNRRLSRLTSDPIYAEALRKLPKRDQRDIVGNLRGAAARKRILELDAERRAKEAGRSKHRRRVVRNRKRVDEFEGLTDDDRTRKAGLDLWDGDKMFWDMYKDDRKRVNAS